MMKKYLTSSFLVMMLLQTVAESRCISGENSEPHGATSQMRREAQIEHRVSDFETFYQQSLQDRRFQQPFQNFFFNPLQEVSQRFDIKQSVRILILENDINLSNAQIMAQLIRKAAQKLIQSPAYQNYDDENPESRLLFSLVEGLDPIYRHFQALAQLS